MSSRELLKRLVEITHDPMHVHCGGTRLANYEYLVKEIEAELLQKPEPVGIRIFARVPEGNTQTILASNLTSRANATLIFDDGSHDVSLGIPLRQTMEDRYVYSNEVELPKSKFSRPNPAHGAPKPAGHNPVA